MRNVIGQTACLNGNPLKAIGSTEPKISVYLSSSEAEFIDDLKSQGIGDLVASLKMIHDHALYHTDLCLGAEEKTALFHLKCLWEGLEKVR